LPAHVSLFSGRPELVHGVDLDRDRPADGVPFLAETLRGAGWRTAGFFSGPYLEPQFGFARGFERYERCYGPALTRALQGGGTQEESSPVHQASHRDVSAAMVTDAALAELDSAQAQPWFLFLHYFDPHYDYVPPAPYDERFDPAYTGSVTGVDFYTNPAISTVDSQDSTRRIRHVSKRDLDHVRALYLGELAWVDAQIGRVLDRLAELELEARTLVIVTADHGEEFFENGGIGHRRTLAEEVLRVPLLLRLPGVLPAGAVPEVLVSHADVAPTLLDLLGVDGPRGAGRSFSAALLGREEAERRAVLGRLVTSTPAEGELLGVRYPARIVTVRETFHSGSLKLLRVRSWPEARAELPDEVRAALAAQQEAAYAREFLGWVDLALHPLDRDSTYSEDFSDARARAALAQFAAEYERLSAIRARGERADEAAFQEELAALGYASEVAGEERLVLPAPGVGR
jgi:hypothetical protein